MAQNERVLGHMRLGTVKVLSRNTTLKIFKPLPLQFFPADKGNGTSTKFLIPLAISTCLSTVHTLDLADMRYWDSVRFLKVSCLGNLSLKNHANIAGFVAVDAEPWGDSLTDIAEIGLAFIPIVNIKDSQHPLPA